MQYIHIDKYKLSVNKFGEEFVLLNSVDQKNLIPLSEAIYKSKLKFAEEVIGTENEICLKLNATLDNIAIKKLESIKLDQRKGSTKYILPVYFNDHEDWEAIQNYSNKSKATIINELISTTLTFYMYGFLPGFLYITGLPEHLQCPRKATPSKSVEAGTIAIGGPYLGLYSCNSPGGWYSIGHCPISVFDPSNKPPTQLQYGNIIQLKSVSQEEYHSLSAQKLDLFNYG